VSIDGEVTILVSPCIVANCIHGQVKFGARTIDKRAKGLCTTQPREMGSENVWLKG